MKNSKKKILIIVGVIFFLTIVASGVWDFFYLEKAHSTFENYYAFRGCVALVERTDSYGICKIKSGGSIKIVKYQGKWYLDGDLPYPGFNFL